MRPQPLRSSHAFVQNVSVTKPSSCLEENQATDAISKTQQLCLDPRPRCQIPRRKATAQHTDHRSRSNTQRPRANRKRNSLHTRAALIGHGLNSNARACGVTSAKPAILFPGAVGGRDRAPWLPLLPCVQSSRRLRLASVLGPGTVGRRTSCSPSLGWGTTRRAPCPDGLPWSRSGTVVPKSAIELGPLLPPSFLPRQHG